MVWDDTTEVGCGWAGKATDTDGWYVVCRYSPPGNERWLTHDFNQHVFCPIDGPYADWEELTGCPIVNPCIYNCD